MRFVSIVALIASIGCGYSCHTKDKKQSVTTSEETIIDDSGSCPYLTKDDKGHVVLSWIKRMDSTTSFVSYAISKDEGKTFGTPIKIPGSGNVQPHGENMPKIIFKSSGEIIAAWGAANPTPENPYTGLVYYSQSFDDGKTWTEPRSLTSDTKSFDQRYFDLAILPNGEVGIVWLDNRKQWKSEGSGLYYAITNGKNGFQNERLIGGPCCPCCRTDLFIDRNKNIHVVYRAILSDSIRDMVHIVSTDDARTFSQPHRVSKDDWVINGCPHTGPAITENKHGIHFTWFTGGSSAGIFYNKSIDNGKTFSAKRPVSGQAAKHCQIVSLSDDNLLIVWNESFPNDKGFASRIGIEERDANGNLIMKDYITSETSNSSFPVIYPGSDNKAVVAYTEDKKDKQEIVVKQVILNHQ